MSQILAGKVLYVANATLSEKFQNHRAARLPYGLAPYVEQLDLLEYVNFYGGPPAPTLAKLLTGVKRILFDRVTVTREANVRRIVVRRLPLPRSMLSMQVQWIYWLLRSTFLKIYDVGIFGHPLDAPLAKILKESGRVRHLFYDDWDYFPSYVEPERRDLIARYEQELIELADGVASVSRPLQDLRASQGAKRTIFLPNGVDFEKFNRARRNRSCRPPTLIYCGAVDARWGIDLAIRALPTLRERIPNFRLIVAGTGSAETELKKLAKRIGVDEAVRFTGGLSYEQLPEIMSEADIGIATSPKSEFRSFARPLKIVEYMAAGLPVIASGGGEAEKMIAESQAGIHIEFCEEAFVQALVPLLQDRKRFEAAQAAAISYAQNLTWDILGKMLAKFVADTMTE